MQTNYQTIRDRHGKTLRILYPNAKLAKLDSKLVEKLATADRVEDVLGLSQERSLEAIKLREELSQIKHSRSYRKNGTGNPLTSQQPKFRKRTTGSFY